MERTKLLQPTIDVVFQALFGENGSERITKRFLEEILNEKIESVDLSENPILRREKLDDKMGILDIIAKINDKEYVNIEMQMSEEKSIIERLLYYWARKYTHQMKKSNKYTKLQRTVVVLIANFNIDKLKDMEYHTKWKIIDEKHRKNILTNNLEMHIIELNKVKDKENMDNELIDWLSFIKNPYSERAAQKMEENKELKEAHEKLKTMSEDEEMQRYAEWRQDGIYLENTLITEGEERGRKIGEKIGRKEREIEIAKKMKKTGADINYISNMTELTIEEIKGLD